MTDTIVIEQGEDLARWLSKSSNEGLVAKTRLAASDRVIARVTDGIYRQPASALRELISNAWDADATSVTILTDAPRFSRIYVRDDGLGMSHYTLTRLLKNIGGSSKRREEGKKLGVVSDSNAELTPGGRPLIGKIGIGLFSISQLARRFQIITKVAGSNYRLTAEIKLRTYSENKKDSVTDDYDEYISGDVLIKREFSEDLDAHGTDIILEDVKPRVRDILRSADRWEAVNERDAALKRGDLETYLNMRVEAPSFHSGYIDRQSVTPDQPVLLAVKARLPWQAEDAADVRMSKLMDAVESEFSRVERPELASTLDAYLEMIWSLGLSAPVPYVDKHPYDLTRDDNIKLFWITKERGRGQEVPLEGKDTVRAAIKKFVSGSPTLTDGLDPVGGFRVEIDGVEIKRPIRFKYHATSTRGLESAVLFVGQFSPDLRKIPEAQRGGELDLESYLFWTGRVIPKENNGVLFRIRGASGANFDPTFLKYQVSEQTRLRQITSELFVEHGLDAALNIDRESFNYAHPHVQLVTIWLHGAIRQLTNRLKDEAEKLRTKRREAEGVAEAGYLQSTAAKVWRERQGDEPLPVVLIAEDNAQLERIRRQGDMGILRAEVLPLSRSISDQSARESQAVALLQVLAAFDVLDDMPPEKQQRLLAAIMSLFVGVAS